MSNCASYCTNKYFCALNLESWTTIPGISILFENRAGLRDDVRRFKYLEFSALAMSSEPNRKAPYSADLRWKVVYQKLARDSSLSTIACNFSISVGTVHNVFKCFTLTGDIAAKAPGPHLGSRKLSVTEELFVINLVSSIYLQEVCEEVLTQIGILVTVPTVCCLLKWHGLTRKNIRQIALQRNMQYHAQLMADNLQYRKEQLVWVDEMRSNCRDSIRKNGYAIKGETCWNEGKVLLLWQH